MNLFINTYTDKNPERDKELQLCLDWNKMNNPSANVYELVGRPTFKEVFNVINSVTDRDSINIIVNSDIYLPENFVCNPEPGECYALSRWDIQPDGSAVHYNNSGSQDTWIFRGAIRMVEGANFTQGVPGCDNKIAYLLTEAGYKVTNPSTTIKTYHLHLVDSRKYKVGKDGRPIPDKKLYRIPRPRINVPIT